MEAQGGGTIGLLVRRAKLGDLDAIEELFKRYEHMMYGKAFWITSNKQDAEDAVQEAGLRAYRAIRTLREDLSFGAFLRKTVANAAWDIVRRRSRDGWVGVEPKADQLPHHPIEKSDRRILIGKLLTLLTPRQREVISRLVMAEQSPEEVAQEMGIMQVTVRTHLCAGIRRLKKELDRR